MVFAHGFGCDQNMWRFVWPEFAESHHVVLFDHVGAGGSDASAFDPDRYSSLRGYADDVLEICRSIKPSQSLTDGMDRLLRVAATHRDDTAATLAAAIVRSLHDPAHVDDVCILTARVR